MGKSAFKLRSNNISSGSSFKMMGASPATSSSSPVKQGLALNLLQKGWRALMGAKKVKDVTKPVLNYADD